MKTNIFLIISSFISSCNEKCCGQECRERTHISCSVTFFRKSTVYEIMWKNIVEPDTYVYFLVINKLSAQILVL